MGIFAPVLASLLIVVEAIVPFLPLGVFITVNFYYFGHFLGFIISWLLTCLGSYIVFKFWRSKVKNWFDGKIDKKENSKTNKLMIKINELSLEKFVLLVTIPFAPAFFINMVAGLSTISEKKFIIVLLIGKIFVVYFWGFIGSSFLDSFNNPRNLIVIAILMLFAFAISKIVNKTYGIE